MISDAPERFARCAIAANSARRFSSVRKAHFCVSIATKFEPNRFHVWIKCEIYCMQMLNAKIFKTLRNLCAILYVARRDAADVDC